MLMFQCRTWTCHRCQMTIASTASSASLPCAALAAGTTSPGRILVVAIGFHSIKPVMPMTTVPHTTAQYSSFSSKV